MDLRQFFLRFFPAFFLVVAAQAQASGISRCQPAEGPPQFTNQPCPEGVPAEPLTLVENTPLDSRAARARLAYGKIPSASTSGPQVVLIEDTYTAERNARISEQPAKKKKKKKRKKKGKTKTAPGQSSVKPTKPAQ